ncbi:DNA polymerase III subunit beta [Mesorhizobium sp. ORM16]|uniref:DNA polymerase III subunit beta n=1 Tax=Mesorhizobium sp. ORM16 TaxID=3376989 RepID=UPI0038572E01
MKFTAERETILAALTFVGKYAASDNKIPIIADVLIKAKGSQVYFVATDLEQAAADSCPAEVQEPGVLCLPASLLLKAIKSSSGEVSLSADDRQATVTIGKSKFKMPVLPAADFPEMPMLTKDGDCAFAVDGAVLTRIGKAVAFSAEQPNGRYFLIGVSWRVHEGQLEFCATDGKKLSLMSVDAPHAAAAMPSVIVPIIDTPSWSGPVNVDASEAFVRFQSGNQTLASKLIEGTYPDYHRLIPKNSTSIILDRQELLASLGRVALVADAKEHSILFVGRDGKVTLSSVTATGEAVDEIAYHGDDFQIAVVHHVAVPILSSFDCETIELRYADHQTGITIHDPNDASRVTFAMPYRDSRLAEFVPAYKEAAE